MPSILPSPSRLDSFTKDQRPKTKDPLLLTFLGLLLLAALLRARTLYDFCFLFADSDQYVLWDAAKDMHQWRFFEPCFYGQSYNPLFEPFLAQPLLFMGLSIRLALPIISGVLGFLPWVLLSYGCFKHQKYISAFMGLLFLLALPLEYQVITSIPRGYIAACALSSIGVYLVLFTQNSIKYAWFAFFAVIAYFTSQNAIYIIFPVGIYLLMQEYKKLKFYKQVLGGTLIALPFPLLIFWFYTAHPEYNQHVWDPDFSLAQFKYGIENAGTVFKFLAPVPWFKLLQIGLAFFVLIAICIIKKNLKAAFSILCGFILLMLTLFFEKSHHGSENVFFSPARMFLGLPLSFIIYSSWAENGTFHSRYSRGLVYAIFVAGVLVFAFQNFQFKKQLYAYPGKPDIIIADSITKADRYCDLLEKMCKTNKTSLVVLDNWRTTAGINYYAAATRTGFSTIIPYGDRRTWKMNEENKITRDRFIFLTGDSLKFPSFRKRHIIFSKLNDLPDAYLVETGGLKVFDILKDDAAEKYLKGNKPRFLP